MGKPSKDYAVPLWEKANLTVYEAAAYSGIGADKLRELSDREDCEFVLKRHKAAHQKEKAR